MIKTLYDRDLVLWSEQQAAALRERRAGALDWDHLAEEIESLGRSDRRELESRLAVLIGHLLKRDHQPALMGVGWRATIREQRRRINKLLQQSPSLRPTLPEAMREAYPSAIDLAIADTGLPEDTFPPALPYTEAEVLGDDGE